MSWNNNAIYFKQQLFPMIKDGRKTSTLRTHTNQKTGNKIELICGKEKLNAIIIDKRKVQMDSIFGIDREVLKKEGYDSEQDLKKILAECYPNRIIKNLWFLEFEIINTDNENNYLL
jgi:hypothetical protein